MTHQPARLPSGVIKLMALNTLCFISFAIVTPVLGRLVREPFGLDNKGVALFMIAHSLAHLTLGLAVGWLSDRLGRRIPLIVVGLLGSSVTCTSLPLIGSFKILLVAHFLEGVFNTIALGSIISRAVDLAGPENRPRTMAFMSISISASFIIAPILTGTLGERSLPLMFAVAGGALALGGLWMAMELGKPESLGKSEPGLRPIIQAISHTPRLWVSLMYGFVDKFSFATLAKLTGLAVEDRHSEEAERLLGWSHVEASSAILLAFWIAFTALCMPSGRICARFGALRPLAVSSVLYGAGFAALGVVGLPGFTALMAICGGLCALKYVPSIALLGEIAPPTQRAICVGAFNVAGSLGMFIAFPIIGALSDRSYGAAYALAGTLEIAAGLLGFSILRGRTLGQ